VSAAVAPLSIEIGPDGRDAYVVAIGGGTAGDARVWQYDVSPAGTLTPEPTAFVANGRFPQGIAISPDGASVYTADSNPSGIRRRSRRSAGAEGAPTLGRIHVGVGGALAPMGRRRRLRPTRPGHRDHAARGALGRRLGRHERPARRLRRLDVVQRRIDRALRLGLRRRPRGPRRRPVAHTSLRGGRDLPGHRDRRDRLSTENMFTGCTASCGGGPSARTTVPVTVSVPPLGSGPQGPPGADGRDRLAVALAARRFRAPAGRRLRAAFGSTMAGRATLEIRRGRRADARKTLRLTIRSDDGQRRTVSARLTVR
jgi:hypothetical protein